MAEPLVNLSPELTIDGPQEWPLDKQVVELHGITVLEDQTDLTTREDDPDIILLRSLNLPEFLNSGAADMPIHRFLVDAGPSNELRTAQDILDALLPKHYASEHVSDLNVTSLPYPGYHPNTENDEIHNDFEHQIFFPTPSEAAYDWTND